MRTWSDNPNVQIDLVEPLHAAGRRRVRREADGRGSRARGRRRCGGCADRFPKLQMPAALLDAYLDPPESPDDCIFAQTTDCVSADLQTRITPCQFGGTPDCANCGCMASAGLAAVGPSPARRRSCRSTRCSRDRSRIGRDDRRRRDRARPERSAQMFSSPRWRWNSALRIAPAGCARRAAQHQRASRRAQRRRPAPRSRAGRSRRSPSCCAAAGSRPAAATRPARRCRAACRWRRTGTGRGCGRSSRSRESSLSCRMCGRPRLDVLRRHARHGRRRARRGG